jgi:hypothetical protein
MGSRSFTDALGIALRRPDWLDRYLNLDKAISRMNESGDEADIARLLKADRGMVSRMPEAYERLRNVATSTLEHLKGVKCIGTHLVDDLR